MASKKFRSNDKYNNYCKDFPETSHKKSDKGDLITNNHRNVILYSGQDTTFGLEFETSVFLKNNGNRKSTSYPENSNNQKLSFPVGVSPSLNKQKTTSSSASATRGSYTEEDPRHVIYPEFSNKQKLASPGASVAVNSYRKEEPRRIFYPDFSNKQQLTSPGASAAGSSYTDEKSGHVSSYEISNKHKFTPHGITVGATYNNIVQQNPEDNIDWPGTFLNRTYPFTYDLESRKPKFSYLQLSGTPHKRKKYEYSSRNSCVNSMQFKQQCMDLRMTLTEVPHYKYYQLLGDSQLLRFSEQLLGYKHRVSYSDGGSRKIRRLGYCISGQKICDLEHELTKMEYRISKKIVLLIGTNDIVQGTPLPLMFKGYKAILSILKEKTEQIVILTVPPIPKLVTKPEVCHNLQVFNEFLKNCAGDAVFVLDLASQLMDSYRIISLQHYERTYNNNESKVDLIHLNRKGFELLKAMLDSHMLEYASIYKF